MKRKALLGPNTLSITAAGAGNDPSTSGNPVGMRTAGPDTTMANVVSDMEANKVRKLDGCHADITRLAQIKLIGACNCLFRYSAPLSVKLQPNLISHTL